MNKSRLEIFSDGVIAIAITIMVLELEPPHAVGLADLGTVLPGLLRYLLSFVYVGIYWVNHHALMDRVSRVDGGVLWANLHLLFWLSLIPFVTAWAGEHPMESGPVALYGAVLLMCSVAFMLLARLLRARGYSDARSRHALWQDRTNYLSILLYALAIGLSVWYAPAGSVIHVIVALLWLRPGGEQREA